MPIYKVQLEQHEWVHTETFEFETTSKANAEKLAQELIDDKQLQVEYRITAEKVEPTPEPEPLAPVAQVEEDQQPDGSTKAGVVDEGGIVHDNSTVRETDDVARPTEQNDSGVVDNSTAVREQ